MNKSAKTLSVRQRLVSHYHSLDAGIKSTEGWGKTVTDHQETFKKLVKVQSRFELALRRHFKSFASERVSRWVNWAQYNLDLIRAYDAVNIVINPDDYEYEDEQDLLLQILQDYVAQAMALGVDMANATYVDSGMSRTTASVQKAALERSSGLVTNITEGTRSRIQQSIATSFELRENVQEAQARLMDIIDDSYRSEMIARTETRNAYVDGSMQVASETGATSKSWDPSSDPCELCQENVDDGEIAIDDDFTNGDDPHPNCLCGSPIFNYSTSDSSDSGD